MHLKRRRNGQPFHRISEEPIEKASEEEEVPGVRENHASCVSNLDKGCSSAHTVQLGQQV